MEENYIKKKEKKDSKPVFMVITLPFYSSLKIQT